MFFLQNWSLGAGGHWEDGRSISVTKTVYPIQNSCQWLIYKAKKINSTEDFFFWSPLVRRLLFWPPSMVYISVIITHILHITNLCGQISVLLRIRSLYLCMAIVVTMIPCDYMIPALLRVLPGFILVELAHRPILWWYSNLNYKISFLVRN